MKLDFNPHDERKWSQSARDFKVWLETKVSYKPGIMFKLNLHPGNSSAYLLAIYARVPDSYGKYRDDITITSGEAVSSFLLAEREYWPELVRHIVHKYEMHELDEWLKVDGKMIRDPHANDFLRV